jgi:hypothetical protein
MPNNVKMNMNTKSSTVMYTKELKERAITAIITLID